MVDVFFIGIGVYMVVYGFTAKSLISESDIPATKEERENAKPTRLGRIIGVGAGLASCLYGTLHALGVLTW
jgi:hypothetical protein